LELIPLRHLQEIVLQELLQGLDSLESLALLIAS